MIKQTSITKTEILQALQHGATVVTGNKRLAVSLQQIFAQAVLQTGSSVWETPDSLPWPIWLQRSWDNASISGAFSETLLPLSNTQEVCIWEQIITQCSTGQPLLQVPATARCAQQAWQLMQAWNLSLNAETFRYNSDSHAFFQWAEHFERRCQENGWLPEGQLIGKVQTAFQSGHLPLPNALILLGFDELTPQQKDLIDALLTIGCPVQWHYISARIAQISRTECDDTAHEIELMARWVKQRVAEDGNASVAVVVPDLACLRPTIMRTLDEVLLPQVLLPGNQYLPRPYNVSLGLSLSQYPIVQTALTLLGFLKRQIDIDDVAEILLSPFIFGWEEEASPRALLELHLRKVGEPQVRLKTLNYYAAQHGRPYSCPLLCNLLTAWQEMMQQYKGRCGTAQWAERYTVLLRSIGWSAGRSLSSEEYQTVEAWRSLLSCFSTLEAIGSTYTGSTALPLLKRLAQQQTFQPQGHTTNIQVLGIFEASGLQFDHLWVMGLHDEVWPAAANPNPFIPLPLQRKAGLPHCNEARELRLCQWISARLFKSANEIRVSYPLKDKDKLLRSSALLMSMPIVTASALPIWEGMLWKKQIKTGHALEEIVADFAPALTESAAQGGSSLFKHQAACPFKAFAEHRLGATPRNKASIGLNAMVRGILTHTLLEKVWCALGSKQALMGMDDESLESLLRGRAMEAVNTLAPHYPVTLTRTIKAMEVERLCQQCQQWLAVEKQRVDFKVVATEAQYTVTLGGIQVNLKIDRIDELADGRRLVIDYKTGKVSPAEWFGERPSDPQLPLYSVAVNDNLTPLAGISFAQIRPQDMAFKGVLAEEDILPGVKAYNTLKSIDADESWSSVLAQWHETLENLGEDFRKGHADVNPKKYPSTCEYCDLHALCRIHEIRDAAVVRSDEDEA